MEAHGGMRGLQAIARDGIRGFQAITWRQEAGGRTGFQILTHSCRTGFQMLTFDDRIMSTSLEQDLITCNHGHRTRN
jgi:hypothetical protein